VAEPPDVPTLVTFPTAGGGLYVQAFVPVAVTPSTVTTMFFAPDVVSTETVHESVEPLRSAIAVHELPSTVTVTGQPEPDAGRLEHVTTTPVAE
jgi:hypothetical protein